MRYFSTRDKNLNFSFKDIFLRGLAPDGGLFIPSELKKYNDTEIKDLSKLSYVDLATEIILNFCKSDLDKSRLKLLIQKSYKDFIHPEVVNIETKGSIIYAVPGKSNDEGTPTTTTKHFINLV